MKPLVIIVKQNKDKGKSATLRILIDNLINVNHANLIKKISFSEGEDQACVLEYKNKRIGFVTIGDPGFEDEFKTGYELCKDYNCNFIIVSTRQKMWEKNKISPYGLIWDFIKNENLKVIETSTYVTYKEFNPSSNEDLNKICATNLANTIDHFITKI